MLTLKLINEETERVIKGLKKKQSELTTTQKNVEAKMRDISMLTNQLENRQRYINDMDIINRRKTI